MHFILPSAGWLLLLFMTCVRATYYIDNTNSAVQYSPTSFWSSGSDPKCFNGTRTFSYCNGDAICQIKFPFTGSGITIYVTLGMHIGTNVSVAIDGNTPTIHTKPPNTQHDQYNVSLYDIQSLPDAAHTIDITVIRWGADSAGEPATVAFDYAAVNGTQSSSIKSHPPIGAIIGGVFGALAVIAATVFALLFHRRQKQKRDKSENDPERHVTTIIDTSHARHESQMSQITPPPYSPTYIQSPPIKANADSAKRQFLSTPPGITPSAVGDPDIGSSSPSLLEALDLASNRAPSTSLTTARTPQSVVNIPATDGEESMLDSPRLSMTMDSTPPEAYDDISPPSFFASTSSPSRHTVPNRQLTSEHLDFMNALYSMNRRAGNV